jgi:hypothetical protein
MKQDTAFEVELLRRWVGGSASMSPSRTARPPNSNEYEAICEFFGWPDAKRAVPSQATTMEGRSSRVRTRRSGGLP